MKMPFGKHEGLPLSEVPPGYLLWVLDHCERISPTLRLAIRIRLGLDPPGTSAPPGEATEDFFSRKTREKHLEERFRSDLARDVEDWFLQVTEDYHPDRRGGAGEAMVALNDAHDRLRKALGLP